MGRLVAREILPNAAAPLVAEFGLRFCFVFLMISALSFLGLGISLIMVSLLYQRFVVAREREP